MTHILENVTIIPNGEHWTWHNYTPTDAQTLLCEVERDGIGYHLHFDLDCTLEQVENVITWHDGVLREVTAELERDYGPAS